MNTTDDSSAADVDIDVCIVDDDPMVCQMLSMIIEEASYNHIKVVATANNGSEAIERVGTTTPDIVLMDIAMPIMDGIDATRIIRSLPSPPHVLMLTSVNPSSTIKKAVEAGAEGFISKTEDPRKIVMNIRQAYEGQVQFNAESQRHLVAAIRGDRMTERREEARNLLKSLPERERTAVLLSAEGMTNQEIAQHMFISERTVKAHLMSAARRLSMDRVGLARLVERSDWEQ